jgi:hypothetical protein
MLSREAISPVWHKAAEGLHNICGAPMSKDHFLLHLAVAPRVSTLGKSFALFVVSAFLDTITNVFPCGTMNSA